MSGACLCVDAVKRQVMQLGFCRIAQWEAADVAREECEQHHRQWKVGHLQLQANQQLQAPQQRKVGRHVHHPSATAANQLRELVLLMLAPP